MDLDIKGTENSVRQDFIEVEAWPLPWSVAGANGPSNATAAPVTVQKRLRHVLPETEEEASIAYDLRCVFNSECFLQEVRLSDRHIGNAGPKLAIL